MRLVILLCLPLLAVGQNSVKSPDGAIELTFSADGGALAYTVAFHGRPVLTKSTLALEIQDQTVLGPHVKITGAHAGAVDETYNMPHGKANPVRNAAHTLAVDVEETVAPFRKFTVESRAYDDGIAFRYVIPNQPPLTTLRLTGERTEFQLAKDATTYPLMLQSFRTSYEDNYHVLPLSALHPTSLVALPLLAELPGVAWVAITEANIDHYAGMYLQHNGREARSLFSKLAPSVDEPGIAVSTGTPARSPWRVVMIGEQPGRLVESNIVINLNPPSAITDLSWIRPGKTSWDWWSGTFAEGVGFRPGMNTDTMKHYIDFSAESGLEYMLIDAGWAQRGNGPSDSGSDLTKTNPNIDMPAILAHAKDKKVGIWLWAHWTDINRQMDEAFALFEKWGVKGVKIDFMDRDDQWMVDFYHRVLRKAADHHLMIDLHGAYKPDGIRRTWPNLLTREGVMGLEYSKWSARITPDHNVMLPFTRMLAGPMDYTPGGFRNVTKEQFEPRNRQPMVMGTRAHELALYPIFESALQMVADYPEAYKGQKEFDFIKAVPAVWDETHVVNGKPGDYITVARRRGREWFVGSITGWHPNELDVSLEFLGRGDFIAEIYSDAADANTNPTHTTREEKRVTAATVLHVKMANGGGQAVRIRPAQ
jgi:alpha-glucosidase